MPFLSLAPWWPRGGVSSADPPRVTDFGRTGQHSWRRSLYAPCSRAGRKQTWPRELRPGQVDHAGTADTQRRHVTRCWPPGRSGPAWTHGPAVCPPHLATSQGFPVNTTFWGTLKKTGSTTPAASRAQPARPDVDTACGRRGTKHRCETSGRAGYRRGRDTGSKSQSLASSPVGLETGPPEIPDTDLFLTLSRTDSGI